MKIKLNGELELENLEKFTEVSSNLVNEYINEWKDQGKKIIGYTCTYAPQELIHAAGILPYRVRGVTCSGTSNADIYMSKFNCSFCRCVLELGLTGSYDFLDGICYLNGCDHIRRVYDNLIAHVKISFKDFLPVPHIISDEGFEYYMEGTNAFKNHIEEHFGVKITEKDLKNSIRVYNETRRLFEELYELRKRDNPPVSGAQTLSILAASTAMPREKFNSMLASLLEGLQDFEGIKDYDARLMIAGSELDHPLLLELIEDLGGLIVTDSLCFGTRQFKGLVEEEGDPLKSISRRYYTHNPCPRMIREYPNKLALVKELINESKVDGAIFERISFCDPHGVDNIMISKELEKMDIPTLVLERDYQIGDAGRFRTRVQAFLERIGG
ncbi:MAG: 2-hydroxyacyl-CoA dehydratase [Candidatus Lokiarchaeota archaeon]|nr:2-hydroxyacyl-CoA dehydratase [Candidatus Lokiarchaeota archaeon]